MKVSYDLEDLIFSPYTLITAGIIALAAIIDFSCTPKGTEIYRDKNSPEECCKKLECRIDADYQCWKGKPFSKNGQTYVKCECRYIVPWYL